MLLAFAFSLDAAVHLVNPGESIADTLAAAQPGDTIWIRAGRYEEHGLVINKNVTLLGDGPESTVIDADFSGRIVVVQSFAQVHFEGLAFEKGKAPAGEALNPDGRDGGACFVATDALVSFSRCKFTQNEAGEGLTRSLGADGGAGGAILNRGRLTLNHCTFEGNKGGLAGAVQSSGTISMVFGGDGGAIYNHGLCRIYDSMFLENSTRRSNPGAQEAFGGSGGAIYNNGRLYVHRCGFVRNRAASHTINNGIAGDGGAIHATGQLEAYNSSFIGNQADGGLGGALFLLPGGDPQDVILALCTLDENWASNTDGIFSSHPNVQLIANSIGASRPGVATGGTKTLSGDFYFRGWNIVENIRGFVSLGLESTDQLDFGTYLEPAPQNLPIFLIPRQQGANDGTGPTAAEIAALGLSRDQRGFPRPETGRWDVGAIQRQDEDDLRDGTFHLARPLLEQTPGSYFNTGTVDQDNKVNWHVVTAPETGIMTVLLEYNDDAADADLEMFVYPEAGANNFTFRSTSTADERFQVGVTRGESYYFRVYHFSGQASYRCTVTFRPLEINGFTPPVGVLPPFLFWGTDTGLLPLTVSGAPDASGLLHGMYFPFNHTFSFDNPLSNVGLLEVPPSQCMSLIAGDSLPSPAEFRQMVNVPGGFVLRGDSSAHANPDETESAIWVPGFLMDRTEVTIDLYGSLYDVSTSRGYEFPNLVVDRLDGQKPMPGLDWQSVARWCNLRSEIHGLRPVYYTDADYTEICRRADQPVQFWDIRANGYRLPTEAEWEKAARGGRTRQQFPFTWDPTALPSMNEIEETSVPKRGSPVDVMQYPANGYGLFDMAGNLAEWVWDMSAAYPGGKLHRHPMVPTHHTLNQFDPNTFRVVRGGSYEATSSVAFRCARRTSFAPSTSSNAIGFRCVRSVTRR